MSFGDFYFGKSYRNIPEEKLGYIPISEDMFNKLIIKFHKDYKYLLEQENFKDDYGYGFKYTLKNKDHIFVLNRWKDEVENFDSIIYIKESTWNEIKDEFELNNLKILYKE